MNDSQTFEPLTKDSLDEHRQIHFYLDQIQATLESLETAPVDAEPLRRLAAQVQSLAERLAEHNHSEERVGGWFQAILEALPDKRIEIDRLTRQHHKFVEILEMARLHADACSPERAPELREDLLEYLEVIRRHEHAEETLMRLALDKETSTRE